MNPNNQSGRVASEKVRDILAELADTICESQDKVILSLKGNTFEIHLEGGTVNISFNMEGGAA